MDPLATYSDLEARLGIVLSTSDQARATTLLSLASDLVRQEAKQDISEVADDVLTMRGISDDELRLPQKPVTSVTSITFRPTWSDGAATVLPDTEWYLDGEWLVRYPGISPSLYTFDYGASGAGWFGDSYELVITYTHGYAEVPAIIKNVVLEAVVRVWINPGSVASEGHGSEQVQYGQQEHRGIALTKSDIEDIRKFLGRPSIRSVNLS